MSADEKPSQTRSVAAPRHRPRLTILVKLLLAFVVPTVALFTVFAVVAHEVARADLEAELGTRLAAVAASAAQQIRGRYLVDLEAGDEDDRAYLNTQRKLQAVREATGVAAIHIFDREFVSRADTDPNIPLGSHYFQAELDRHELARVFDAGAAVSSVLFSGVDGVKYKAGYAPVYASDSDREIVLALAVDAPATYFLRLADLRRSLLLYGIALALLVVAIAVLMATLITRPVRALVTAAERIGGGDLQAPIARLSRDELGFLAETMDGMRRELSARDERMQLMLSGIAHEVRNPLGGIELFAGILRDELDGDDERRSHVLRIERELGYLSAVVNSFLDYARRPRPELGEVASAALMHEVVELLSPEAERAAVPLRAAPAGDVAGGDGEAVGEAGESLLARADSGQLRRALLNLVRNAIQASAGVEDGEVRVTVGRRADRVYLEVYNRGRPLPDEVRARMFEPFYTTREKGTGLGLAFVKEIVEDHGGAVEVSGGVVARPGGEGAEVGETTFRIVLPGA